MYLITYHVLNLFTAEGVDEMIYIKLTECQILRMRKDMTMRVQTEMIAKQREMRKVNIQPSLPTYVVIVQFQYYWLYRKLPIPLLKDRGRIQKSMLFGSNLWIIKNPISKIFSPFAKFYMINYTKLAPKPYIETLISNRQTVSSLKVSNSISNEH